MPVRTTGAYFSAATDYLVEKTEAKQQGGDNLVSPLDIAEAARLTMGGIDLDPMSHAIANEIVMASEFWTPKRTSDIFKLDWYGRVYLYPPRRSQVCTKALEKLWLEHNEGRVREAVFFCDRFELLRACPWLHDYPICYPYQKPKILRLTGRELEPIERYRNEVWGFVVYFPDYQSAAPVVATERFLKAFSTVGRVVQNRIEDPTWVEYWRRS
ncbi:hypothetical protein [Synechococcus elongatus]|uniref:hypothetical protein n=1 Tax=Synechococcus elongatus TaxID=32046 RepID=UPI000F7F8A40|nr:hypothetical protein [Synechococcus elongatus]